MPVLTARLALVAVALAAVRLVLPDSVPGGLWSLNGALLLAAVADFFLTARPSKSLTVERRMSSIVTLGGVGTITWAVHNKSGRVVRLSLADELAPSLHADDRRVSMRVQPLGETEATVKVRPARRGRFPLDTVVLRIASPLGLVARQERISVPGEIKVHPPFRSKDEAEIRINKARILEIGLQSAKGRGGGREFDQLREYTVDDEFRRIDWAATARSNRTIVRDYRSEQNQTVLTLLDAGRVMAGQVDGVPRLEHGMDAVMMLTTVATRLGDRAGLITFDSQVRSIVAPRQSRRQVGLAVDAMFDLRPSLVESDYQGVFAETLTRFQRRTLLVVITELASQAVEATLIPAMPLIATRHLVLIGSVRDPAVERWAMGAPQNPAEAARKAAAILALEDRERMSARLRALGATVVDAPPGKLSGQLADAYLRVKASGRL